MDRVGDETRLNVAKGITWASAAEELFGNHCLVHIGLVIACEADGFSGDFVGLGAAEAAEDRDPSQLFVDIDTTAGLAAAVCIKHYTRQTVEAVLHSATSRNFLIERARCLVDAAPVEAEWERAAFGHEFVARLRSVQPHVLHCGADAQAANAANRFPFCLFIRVEAVKCFVSWADAGKALGSFIAELVHVHMRAA